MRNLLTIIIAIFLLSSCQSNSDISSLPQPSIQIIEKPVFPQLSEYKIPEDIVLLPVEGNMPRDNTKLVPKDLPHCTEVPEEERNEIYWKECGENPIISDSNIFIGFDYDNWTNLQINLSKLKEYTITLKEIINEINRRIKEIQESEKEEIEKFNKKYEEFRNNLNLNN